MPRTPVSIRQSVDSLESKDTRLRQVLDYNPAARWGGGGFVIVLPCTLADAMSRSRMLEQNLGRVYAIHMEGAKLRLRLTLASGIAEQGPGETVDPLMARPDQSLSTHKQR